MPTARVKFHGILQDSQDYGSFEKNDDHLVSVINFTLEVNGRTYDGMRVEVRQPYGADYATDPLEVGRPLGTYRGTWNHHAFADLCEAYYRSAIGVSGWAIGFAGHGIRMRNNKAFRDEAAEFDIP